MSSSRAGPWPATTGVRSVMTVTNPSASAPSTCDHLCSSTPRTSTPSRRGGAGRGRAARGGPPARGGAGRAGGEQQLASGLPGDVVDGVPAAAELAGNSGDGGLVQRETAQHVLRAASGGRRPGAGQRSEPQRVG